MHKEQDSLWSNGREWGLLITLIIAGLFVAPYLALRYRWGRQPEGYRCTCGGTLFLPGDDKRIVCGACGKSQVAPFKRMREVK